MGPAIRFILIIRAYTTYTYKELNMRQQRSLKLVKDYDSETLYHLRKANIVGNALSPKFSATIMSLQALQSALQEEKKIRSKNWILLVDNYPL